MFSWLGLGQKDKQDIAEEENSELQVIAENNEAELVENTAEPVMGEAEAQTDSVLDDKATEAGDDHSEEAPIDDSIAASLNVTDAPEETSSKEEVDEAEQVIEIVNQPTESDDATIENDENIESSSNVEAPETEDDSAKKLGFFTRLRQGLSKTRQNLGGGLASLFLGKQIDDDLFEELETHLLMADVGVETTMKIIDSLTQTASRKQLKDATALYDLLKVELKNIINDVSKPLVIPEGDGPFVILMVGVNGVGKTTTIGKLAKQFQAQGKSVMLAAGDTFRAAAVEQLQVWGDRNDIPVIAQHTGADSASVIFDAISAAKARKVDVIIADTAGRLQNKAHLMEELKKVVRVMKKLDVKAPHEVMLTIDAGTGQNALSQTKLFNDAVGLTGLTITKLDGTAKGGVVFAVADKHAIPIRYLGVGEGIDDLRPFDSDDFINAIFSN